MIFIYSYFFINILFLFKVIITFIKSDKDDKDYFAFIAGSIMVIFLGLFLIIADKTYGFIYNLKNGGNNE